jgi:hypothetical protein
MALNLKMEDWVWVFINPSEVPGLLGQEQLLGQTDSEMNISYIPAFKNKDQAQTAYSFLSLERGKKYEPQAIIYEDLLTYARENGLLVFFLDKEGNILEKVTPTKPE